MFTQPLKLLISVFTAVVLTACSSYRAVDDHSKTVTHPDWTVSGKLAFISPEERVSANLYWQHHASNGKDELRLTGPLGVNVLSLSSFPGFATVTIDGKSYQSDDADSLIVRLTGWPLPLSQLGQYLLGDTQLTEQVSSANHNQRQQIELTNPNTGETSQLIYHGWQQLSGYKVPRQLELRQGDQRIKLAIKEWQPELPTNP
ncbi:lipoprotein insertase outer membrane protein LolB [Ferrimonas senticii]|uniref:lipoprotein insertase outer membrane protein LolB n=1 Tax=Ferrimonas senticii TaxID=394566 RepID=UPI00040B173C|nr:lipoprotein insertase outer membrane protein LolB [Ferrimonas senticii]